MTWLLTGGAGYIGAHVLRALRDAGHGVVVLDDLSSGDRARVPADVPFVEANVFDRSRVLAELRRHDVRGVVHLAAKKSVPESVARPLHYYEENIGGFASLLGAMGEAGVDRMVLSSSAAVIGTPAEAAVREGIALRPENPYGRSKLACEWMLADVGAATGLHHASLRYFNVAGAGSPELGDIGESNLIPMVFRALHEGRPPQVFGGDYPTPDGSCVRDYIHVADLARAHVAAVRRLVERGRRDAPYAQTFNVGRGEGVSVREIMAVTRKVTGLDFAYEVAARRPGDPASVVGVVDKIEAELGWKAELGLEDMIGSAWAAWQTRTD